MKYARVQDARVTEIIDPFVTTEANRPPAPIIGEGEEPTPEQIDQQRRHDEFVPGPIPIGARFSPEIVATLVEIPSGIEVAVGDSYNGIAFGPPPTPAVPPASAVMQVSMRQARLALLAAGKLAEIDAVIASLPSPKREAAQIEWNYSATVERSSAIVALLGPLLDLDSAALDALFLEAAAL